MMWTAAGIVTLCFFATLLSMGDAGVLMRKRFGTYSGSGLNLDPSMSMHNPYMLDWRAHLSKRFGKYQGSGLILDPLKSMHDPNMVDWSSHIGKRFGRYSYGLGRSYLRNPNLQDWSGFFSHRSGFGKRGLNGYDNIVLGSNEDPLKNPAYQSWENHFDRSSRSFDDQGLELSAKNRLGGEQLQNWENGRSNMKRELNSKKVKKAVHMS